MDRKKIITKTKIFSPPHFHTSKIFSFLHLDIPFLLVKSLVKFDTLDDSFTLPVST